MHIFEKLQEVLIMMIHIWWLMSVSQKITIGILLCGSCISTQHFGEFWRTLKRWEWSRKFETSEKITPPDFFWRMITADNKIHMQFFRNDNMAHFSMPALRVERWLNQYFLTFIYAIVAWRVTAVITYRHLR